MAKTGVALYMKRMAAMPMYIETRAQIVVKMWSFFHPLGRSLSIIRTPIIARKNVVIP